jgi:hypothetical protein
VPDDAAVSKCRLLGSFFNWPAHAPHLCLIHSVAGKPNSSGA